MPERIQDIFYRLDQGIAQTVRNCRLLTVWAEIVDERVNRNTEAIKIINRTLHITASSPVWAQELSFLKKALIDRFNEKAGEEAIRDIRFRAS